jgi:hypothetical protein
MARSSSNPHLRRSTVLLVAFFIGVLHAGCGTHATPAAARVASAPASASLEERVRQYWERRQAKDLAGAYPFYCAAYRSRVPQNEYLQMTRLVRFDLRDVKIAGTTPSGGAVAVTIAYRFLMPTISDRPVDGQATEMWMRDTDGQWCKQDEPLLLPFPRGGPADGSQLRTPNL